MIKRLAAETDAEAIFSLSQFAFQYTLSDEAFEKKKEEAWRHIIWGWMQEGELAAKLHLIPLYCYINGERFAIGGVSSVATWPEHRRQGAVKQLLKHALRYMRQNGQTLSFLHPFSFAFYRKYGWQHVFSKKEYRMPITRLKREWHTSGYVRRMGEELGTLQAVYTEYAKRFNGMLDRDAKWWQQRVLKDNWHKAVAYGADGTAEGYMLYKVENELVRIQEIVPNSLNAQQLLLQFIANHDSMAETVVMSVPEHDNLPLMLDEPRFEQKLKPYFMARIVDVHTFLRQFPFRNAGTSVVLHINDSFLPENSGAYHVRQSETGTNVTHLSMSDSKQLGIQCNTGHLAAMLLGYKRPAELHGAGLIQGDREAVAQLDAMIPRRQPFFLDFF
ncbi:GNAT family N-acetyltransferase [Lentibacillus juripiscarius]|uniref:Enhanced intracellular survival protein Eis n=1 Tax=Lentibacillus juripiscarius TaxID=257446 RepID=A0ABW5V9E2_9BACI